jgi:membrane protein required for beta-lactamase induction
MLNVSGSRWLAIGCVATVLGAWTSSLEPGRLAHYRSLSREALMAELAEKHAGRLSSGVPGALLVVCIVVFAVDLLSFLFDETWCRLRPAPPTGEG